MDVTGPGVWAGAGSVPVPVPPQTPMAGYIARSAPSSGVLRPLEVNALCLRIGAVTAAVLSLDAVAVDADFVARLRARLAAEHGIDPDHVLVAASHTHSGPIGMRIREGDPVDAGANIRRSFHKAASAAVHAAVMAIRPAAVTVHTAAIRGVAVHRTTPDRPVDDTATLLRIDARDATPIACLWHFACHPTVLGADNTLISPDLPGDVRALLRDQATAQLPVIYLNGAAGDVSTRFTRRSQTPAELARLAGLITSAWPARGATLALDTPRAMRRSVPLPGVRVSRTSLRNRLEATEQALRSATGARRRIFQTQADALGRRLRLLDAASGRNPNPDPRPVPADLHALALGDLALAAVPGEPMAATGLALRARGPHPLTLPVGYAGDYIGYLPTLDMTEGYEVAAADVAPGCGELAADALIAQLTSLAAT